MEMQRIEYVRKNSRNKGRKKGVLYCGIDPEDKDSVVIGFSLCNSVDRFDYIHNKHVAGFGLDTAKIRAEKWRLHTSYFVQKSFTEDQIEQAFDGKFLLQNYVNPEHSEIVEIPPSITRRLKTFIIRCKKYYKDKEFPEWVHKFDQNDSYPSEMIDEKVVMLF